MKILIAEDDSVTRLYLKATLEKLGYEVLEAEDGKQALEIHRRERVRVVVLDWLMPKLDGLEFCRRIRAAPARGRERSSSSAPPHSDDASPPSCLGLRPTRSLQSSAVADPSEPFLPSVVERRRAEPGGSRRIGIDIGHHVYTTITSPLDHPQRRLHVRRIAHHASNVYDLCRRAGDGSRRNDFLHGIQAAVRRRHGAEVADMQVAGNVFSGGQLKESEHLQTGCARNVCDAEPYAHSAGLQSRAGHAYHRFDLCRRRGRIAVRYACRHAQRPVPHRRAVVMIQTSRDAFGIPGVRIDRPPVHRNDGGDAVEDLEDGGLVRTRWTRQDVDQPGCNYETSGIDRCSRVEVLFGDHGDEIAAHADVANSVEPRLGIDHSPSNDGHIVRRLGPSIRCRQN
ncbi:MAG: response regulator [Gemmatimonadetes bacterium]|nr:response regulator [Gemmatimonadota bacterium]